MTSEKSIFRATCFHIAQLCLLNWSGLSTTVAQAPLIISVPAYAIVRLSGTSIQFFLTYRSFAWQRNFAEYTDELDGFFYRTSRGNLTLAFLGIAWVVEIVRVADLFLGDTCGQGPANGFLGQVMESSGVIELGGKRTQVLGNFFALIVAFALVGLFFWVTATTLTAFEHLSSQSKEYEEQTRHKETLECCYHEHIHGSKEWKGLGKQDEKQLTDMKEVLYL